MRISRKRALAVLRRTIAAPLLAWAALCASSCAPEESRVAILWTDRPDFAFYVQYFNASQDRYMVEVFHHDFPAQRLRDSPELPDIVVASWLQGASARAFFTPMDEYLYGESQIEYAFYSGLLAKGNVGGTQYLLPVSFNAPLAVFAAEHSGLLCGPLAVGLEEMRDLGRSFNAMAGGVHARMGFSPTWDDNFLLVIADIFGASFAEADPVDWDSEALGLALEFASNWIAVANAGAQATENFTFRFFNIPPAGMALSGRILFAYMDSAEFFTLAEDQRESLDFRWIAERDSIPLAESAAYLGLVRGGRAPGAADAFVRWFFSADAQRALLERSHKFRQMETSFGIADGFSALRPVTEQIFPTFYPDLLGRIPPEDFFSPAGILPDDWAPMKEQVVLPYLRERAMRPGGGGLPLETRLADWARLNRF